MDHAVKASVRKFALWPESTQTTNKFCLSYLIVRCCVCVRVCVWIGPLCCHQLLTGLLAGTAAVLFTFPPDTLGCSETSAIIRSYVVRHPPLGLRG